MTSVTN